MIEARLLQHQLDFIEDCTTPFIGLVGGYRSGKTVALCYKALMLASLNAGDGALLEPTYGMISRTLVPTFNKILNELKLTYKHNKSAASYEIKMGPVWKKIWLLSAENYERAAGMTLSWFGIDEVDLMSHEIAKASWNMMVSRLTLGQRKQGFCVSTPEGYRWMYEFFEVNANASTRLIRASTYDNPFIDKEYFSNMERTHTKEQLEAYFYGRFVNFTQGNVYYCYDRELNRTIETLAKHPNAPLNIGIDFNVQKMACTIAIIMNQKTHVVKELYGSANTESLIKDIKRTVGPNRLIRCFVDSSGNSMQSSFTAASLSDVAQLKLAFGQENVKHYKGHIPIADRVAAVNGRFHNGAGQRSLLINDVECPILTRCIETQGFIDGKPDKSNDLDHLPDALGYEESYLFPPYKHRAKITLIN